MGAGLLMDVQPKRRENYFPISSYIISNDVEGNRMKVWYFYQKGSKLRLTTKSRNDIDYASESVLCIQF
jgi:hypothetical protein